MLCPIVVLHFSASSPSPLPLLACCCPCFMCLLFQGCFWLISFSAFLFCCCFFLVRFSANKYSNDFVYNKLEEWLLLFLLLFLLLPLLFLFSVFFCLPELWATYAAYSPSNILSGCPPYHASLSSHYCGFSCYVLPQIQIICCCCCCCPVYN